AGLPREHERTGDEQEPCALRLAGLEVQVLENVVPVADAELLRRGVEHTPRDVTGLKIEQEESLDAVVERHGADGERIVGQRGHGQHGLRPRGEEHAGDGGHPGGAEQGCRHHGRE
ncbi:MAG: hypothetical protein ACK56I_19540, partial [bacterium]